MRREERVTMKRGRALNFNIIIVRLEFKKKALTVTCGKWEGYKDDKKYKNNYLWINGA